MKILHISSENIANVPITLVHAHRRLGHYARLITFFKNSYGFEEDIVLNLPFSKLKTFSGIKKLFKIGTYSSVGKTELKYFNPKLIERVFFNIRDEFWKRKISRFSNFINSFDIYIYYGGLDFLRNCEIIRELKKKGKKIGIIYLGSDLRLRGIIRCVEECADRIFTVEFDHTFFHPRVEYIFLPIDVWSLRTKEFRKKEYITICHAPTNRFLKGTDYLIDAYNELKDRYPVKLLILENMNHNDVLKIKYEECDIFVDQLTDFGGFGYGMNSLESLGMGIPTITYLNEDYEKFIPDHPFINASYKNIKEKLEELLKDEELRKNKGFYGRLWVEKYHDAQVVGRYIIDRINED
jgi:glycosyltransferase involved in cell wall biosynthesis